MVFHSASIQENGNHTIQYAEKYKVMSDTVVRVENDALNLRWAYGVSSGIPNAVHNLSISANQTILFYTCSNNGIIYNVQTETQYLLQGHVRILIHFPYG